MTIPIEAVWNNRLKVPRWETPDGLYYYDETAATRPERFSADCLRHTIGEWSGQPFEYLPWQRQLISRPAFGWKRRRDDLRRFRFIFLEVAKKNGKSAFASSLAALLLSADGEPSAQVYSAAADREQAEIVFNEAAKMVEGSPVLLTHGGLVVHKRAISQDRTGSSYKALSRAPATKHGFNVHGLIFDEFHTQKTRELWDVLYKGTSSRRQPMVIIITTAGSDRESICYEQYEDAKRLIAGTQRDDTLLPVIFEASHEDDWTDPKVWEKANPSLGVTKRVDYMADECAKAQNSPRKLNSFLNLELNVWTESREAWILPDRFNVLAREEPEPAWLVGLPCTMGVDLSARSDLTSVALAFRETIDPEQASAIDVELETGEGDLAREVLSVDFRVHLHVMSWIPEARMQDRIKRDRVRYDVWAREGWLRTVPGPMIVYDYILRYILEMRDKYGPREIGFDNWQAFEMTTKLQEEGAPMVEVPQNYRHMSAPAKLLEALVLANRLTFSGSPVTAWALANTEVKHDDRGNIMVVKPDPKGFRRIDPIVASIIALSRLMALPNEKRSVYETRGLISL